MKKLVLFFSIVCLTAISVNVFAQSTGTTPAPGATHSYFITPGNVANTIAWSVTKGDLTTAAGADAVISASTAATTDITWAASVQEGDWYYVHVIETDGTGCSNEKVLPVQITASPFYLTLAAANETQCYDGAVTASIGITPDVINYDHGTATIVFTVTPTGLSGSYSGYSFNLAIDYGTYTGLTQSVSVDNGANLSGSTVEVPNNDPVTITYVIDNNNVYTNTSAANAQNYTATATISSGKAINGVSDNGTGAKTDDTAVARPNTSGIGTN